MLKSPNRKYQFLVNLTRQTIDNTLQLVAPSCYNSSVIFRGQGETTFMLRDLRNNCSPWKACNQEFRTGGLTKITPTVIARTKTRAEGPKTFF